jgi:hypothetical protein
MEKAFGKEFMESKDKGTLKQYPKEDTQTRKEWESKIANAQSKTHNISKTEAFNQIKRYKSLVDINWKKGTTAKETSNLIGKPYKGTVYIAKAIKPNKAGSIVIIDSKTNLRWSNEYFKSPGDAELFALQNGLGILSKPLALEPSDNTPTKILVGVSDNDMHKRVILDPKTKKRLFPDEFFTSQDAYRFIESKGLLDVTKGAMPLENVEKPTKKQFLKEFTILEDAVSGSKDTFGRLYTFKKGDKLGITRYGDHGDIWININNRKHISFAGEIKRFTGENLSNIEKPKETPPKTTPKNTVNINGEEIDCDDLIAEEKERLAKRRNSSKEYSKKRESTKNIARVKSAKEQIENSLNERLDKGEMPSKSEIQKLLSQAKDLLSILEEYAKEIKK